MNMKQVTPNRVLSVVTGSLAAILTVGLFAISSAPEAWAAEPVAHEHHADVTVYKAARCGCCDKWAEQMQASGLEVDVVIVDDPGSIKRELGIPRNLASCHTAVAGDYWIEGHVPIDLTHQLLKDQPDDIRGIAVPGMPAGSPGMESPNPVTYQVLSVDKEGQVGVFAVRKGKASD